MLMATEGVVAHNSVLSMIWPWDPKQAEFQKMVGYCAFIHGALISQLGLLDKNDLAWQYARYDKMVETMRAEFELDKRTAQLREKIAVIARDAGTFVSMLQHDRSTVLETTIIVLIALECVLSLVDLTSR